MDESWLTLEEKAGGNRVKKTMPVSYNTLILETFLTHQVCYLIQTVDKVQCLKEEGFIVIFVIFVIFSTSEWM